ncbi:MAG TPA: hypothetical protein PKE03_07380 [Bacteroidales bacterium]|nr:hypothetical protein [Bacteroidales bacterium]
MNRTIAFRLIIFSLMLLISASLPAQTPQYNRNALTVLMLDAGDVNAKPLMKLVDSIKIPDKFFDHQLSTKVLPLPDGRRSLMMRDTAKKIFTTASLERLLTTNRVPNEMVAKWFSRKPDGTFGVELLSERGLYNANDDAALVAAASKRGTAALMDLGMGLVDRSYLLVLDFPRLITMEQLYERDSTPAEQRIMNGYVGTMNAYVFKLDFGEQEAAAFFENLWVNSDSPDKAARVKAFDSYDFKIKPVSVFTEELSATQLNPGQKFAPKQQRTSAQLLQSMFDGGFNNVILRLEGAQDEFRVKAMIHDTKPIAIKIGRKEGLKFDQRYFVFENRQDHHGNVYKSRRGVIRAMSVADNRNMATGETTPSYFYQIAGGKIDAEGMFAEQKNSSGFNLLLGYASGGLGGGYARMDIMISPILYEVFGGGKIRKGMTAWKIWLEGALNYDTAEPQFVADDYVFYRGGFGLSKEIFLLRNLFVEPSAGYLFERANPTGDVAYYYTSQHMAFDVRLGLNITYRLQLMPALHYYIPVSTSYFLTKDTKPVKLKFEEEFDERTGPGFGLGLRFMF